MATFEELLAATGLPEPALAPLKSKWEETFSLITQNNQRVAQVNAAKAADPNKPGYEDELDKLWRMHEKDDAKITPLVEKFDVISAEYEKLLGQLRELAKGHIPEQLSEERTKEVRKLVNESGPTIVQAKAQLGAMAMMVDSFLDSMGKGIEGGLVTLLPDVESLKNTRGRKAATSSGEVGQYMTRILGAELNGKDVARDGKVNFRYLADAISSDFKVDTFPENKVTGEEVEEAYYEAIEKPHRSVKTAEVTKTFDFTKEIVTGENTKETRTVKVKIVGKADAEKAATDNKSTETPEKTEAPEKVNATPEKVEAPVKKAAATAPTKEVPAKK